MAGKKRAVIRMYNGRLVDVYDLQPEDIIPENFIHALSLINRYTGATRRPYSVAEHTVRMGVYLRDEHKDGKYILNYWDKLKAIHLHDWTEALYNDIASPVKKSFPTYKKHEKEAARRIFEHYGVPYELEKSIKWLDTSIRVDEKLAMWDASCLEEYDKGSSIYEGDVTRLGITIDDWSWTYARYRLAVHHFSLFNEDVNFAY